MMYDYQDTLQTLLASREIRTTGITTRQVIDLCAVKGLLRETRKLTLAILLQT